MSEPINPLVVDLSHWIPAKDYDAVKRDGVVACIYKATEGQSYTDDTYVDQQKAAKKAGLKWGAYHFADASDTDGQVRNFMSFACPDPDEVFVLDWEDNPSGNGKMSKAQAKDWITQVETELGRPGECVIYGGNTLKELVGDDPFFGSRRLWLCQYASDPVLPDAWDDYWLWQFTDGNYGPTPHEIDGIGHCDINSYQGSAQQLIGEWASGSARPPQPGPGPDIASVHLNVQSAGMVEVTVAVNGEVIYGKE
jgi:lysozyme